MRYSGFPLVVATTIGLAALALNIGGCQKAAISPATTLAANAPRTDAPPQANSATQAEPERQCRSWGIQPGTPGYKECVDGMKEAADAEASAGSLQTSPQTPVQMRAELSKTRDDMRKRMAAEMNAAANDPRCVKTTNGSNVSYSCS